MATENTAGEKRENIYTLRSRVIYAPPVVNPKKSRRSLEEGVDHDQIETSKVQQEPKQDEVGSDSDHRSLEERVELDQIKTGKVQQDPKQDDSNSDNGLPGPKRRGPKRPLYYGCLGYDLQKRLNKAFDSIDLRFANKALEFYNQEQGHAEYELVKSVATEAGIVEEDPIKLYVVAHTNFKARPKNNPRAPVELFFAELVYGAPLQVHRCCSLGRSSRYASKRYAGCKYCDEICHPRDKGFEGSIVR